MRFSVVIPLYNKQAHIAEAIQSVLDQSFRDFEVVVVDDGSTDNSLEEARKWERENLRVVAKANGGTASARNCGIRESLGEHICFLDADDYWKPHFLEQVNELVENFPQAGIYCTAYEFSRGQKLYHPGYYGIPEGDQMLLVPDYFQSVLMGEQIATASSTSVPKAVFQEMGLFNENIRSTEDQEMWNRISMKYPVAFHTRPAAVYRQDALNMKTRKLPSQEIEYAASLQRQLDLGQVPAEREAVARKIIAANLIGAGAMNLLAGDKKMALKFFNDPRTEDFPERKAVWKKLMWMPSFLLRLLYRLRNKMQNRR